MIITANELKTKGVKAIESKLKDNQELLLTVRGKAKYVIISVEEHDRMRAAELDLAYYEVKEDIKNGRYTTSLEEHFKLLEDEINTEK